MITAITHSCGHEVEMDLKDSAGNEPGPRSLTKSVAFHSGRECKECWKSGKQAETVSALTRFGELPELGGSAKQVYWAKVVRDQTLIGVGEWLDLLDSDENVVTVEKYLQTAEAVAEYRANMAQARIDRDARVALLVRVIDARFWIDTRSQIVGKEGAGLGESILEGRANYVHHVKFDLDEGKVFLSKRGKAKEIYSRTSNRYIMVGGNKFYDNEVTLAEA